MRHLVTSTLLAAALAAVPARGEVGDADLLAARDAYQRNNVKALEGWRERFAGHALEAYPAYWLLLARVEKGAEPSEVRAFLARHADTPLAESLRREWLKALGAAGSWDLFRAEHPRLVGDDPEITCHAFRDRLARGDAEAAVEARVLFLAARETPSACDPVFAALAAEGRIGAEEAWHRIRRLLAEGHVKEAKRANPLLPALERLEEKALERIARNPGAYLAREKLARPTRAARETALFAVHRLARQKPELAAERLEALAPRLDPQEAGFAWAQVATQAALSHHPRALEWYAAAGDAPLTEAQIAWKARAGLRAGNWKAVLGAIQAMSPEVAREPAWRYWRARALRTLGAGEAAEALLRGLARETHFYGLLAAEDVGLEVVPDWKGWHPQPADLARVQAMPGIRRALALYRIGLDGEALREWLWAVRHLDDASLLAAAEVARQANLPDRAINTAERTVQLHDFGQRYPTHHRDALEAAARQWGLDEALVFGIVRQESRFMAEARSRAGAMGLMQLMPSTARWVARQISVERFRPGMLTQPDVNIHMGTYYLRRVLGDLGHRILAAAAYNAGPGRARRWRDERSLEGAIYAETIPFDETRDYVKKVMANMWFYSHRLRGESPPLGEILGKVPGRAGEAIDTVAAEIP